MYGRRAFSGQLEQRYDEYLDSTMDVTNERIQALKERVVEIENGELGKIARGFSDGVVFSKDELLTMPIYCFYDIGDVLLAIELEEEYLREHNREHNNVVKLQIDDNEEDILPGQISIWDLLESGMSNERDHTIPEAA